MMSRIRFGATIAGCVAILAFVHPAAVLVESQKPSPESAEPPETTLTGCLKSYGADTAIAGPSGRLYTLEVIEKVVPSSTPTTSTPSATPPSTTITTYSLDNVGKVELEKHANHQVQLTGRMQAPSKAAQDSATSGGTPATAKPSSGGGHRTFHVTALKTIAAKCS